MSSRVQLALNVTDVESATKFYTQLFGTEPHKVREGYANFAIADPPLKLVLLENPNPTEALNHLGVELSDQAAVEAASTAFTERGLDTKLSTKEACCHAVQDKVYVTAPDVPVGMWEFYTVVDDNPDDATNADGVCCAPTATGDRATLNACGSPTSADDQTPCCD